MTDEIKNEIKNLAKKVKRFQEQTAARDHARYMNSKYSRDARVREDMRKGWRFAYQFTQGLLWIYNYIILPVSGPLRDALLWLWYRYRQLWAYCVYRRTDDYVLLFSKTRAGIFILASGIFGWYLLVPILDLAFLHIPVYVITADRNETVFLQQSEEIDSNDNTQVVKGCLKFPCETKDAIYFRVKSTPFSNMWSVVHNFYTSPNPMDWLFYPEFVAAVVPNTPARCSITSYGFRFRFITRYMSFYPYLLSATCEKPIKDN